MKKVLIAGANSYIGTTFDDWVHENEELIETDTIDMQDEVWSQTDFSGYDAIFHVAGIAHADVDKVTEEQKVLYYKINTDLAIECAAKAKKDGVKQFIFMSSIIVYGDSAGIGEEKVITKDTPLAPTNFYGDSKRRAEEGLLKLADESFKVVILRPPMIYGRNSKGNYHLLSIMARKLPIFPDVDNRRSMLYVGNLCKFVTLMVEYEEDGIFFPQNREYVQTSDMVKRIAESHEKRIGMIKVFNSFLRLLGRTKGKWGGLVNKAFGNMIYDSQLSMYKEEYQIYDLTKSIELSEGTE